MSLEQYKDKTRQELLLIMDIQVEEYQRLLDESGKRIAELEEERDWISVEDRLPETGRYLAIGRGCESEIVVFLAFVGGGGKFKAKGRDCTELVTHWMPLPNPPKEQGK
jgi:hypothetical protein